jgi:hypothetical protein
MIAPRSARGFSKGKSKGNSFPGAMSRDFRICIASDANLTLEIDIALECERIQNAE